MIENKVFVVPFDGEIEQEPFSGGRLMMKFNELELFTDGN